MYPFMDKHVFDHCIINLHIFHWYYLKPKGIISYETMVYCASLFL